MFNQTFAATGGLFQRAMTGGALALGGLAFAASLAATPASAADIMVNTVQFVDSQQIGITDTGRPAFIMSPFYITSTDLDALTLAFCIQFDIDMPYTDATPIDQALTLDTMYQDEDLLGANRAVVGQLVNYGTSVFKSGSLSGADLALELSAVQGAIWTLTMGETFSFDPFYFTDSSLLATMNDKIIAYSSGSQPTGYSSDIRTIVSKDPRAAQGLAFAGVTPVPEPGTWALMIGGFFCAGAAMRRGQRRAPAAV